MKKGTQRTVRFGGRDDSTEPLAKGPRAEGQLSADVKRYVVRLVVEAMIATSARLSRFESPVNVREGL